MYVRNIGNKKIQNQNLAEKNAQVHGYLLYTKCHQDQLQELVSLGPLIIACGWKKKYFHIGMFEKKE